MRTIWVFLLFLLVRPLLAGSNTNLVLFDQKAYQTRVEPALLVYLNVGDSKGLIGLIKPLLRPSASAPSQGRWGFTHESLFLAALDLLAGKPGHEEHLVFDNGKKRFTRHQAIRNLVEGELAQALVNEICLVRENGQILEFNIWDSRIFDFLNSNSPWIKDQFWGMTPYVDYSYRFSSYSGSGPLPVWFVSEFGRELDHLDGTRLTGAALAEFALLRRMVGLANKNPDLRLVLEY